MRKTLALLAVTSCFALSAARAHAQVEDQNNRRPRNENTPQTVPDAGASALLLGGAISGLTGLRMAMKKKN